jgi:hypothetical protein
MQTCSHSLLRRSALATAFAFFLLRGATLTLLNTSSFNLTTLLPPPIFPALMINKDNLMMAGPRRSQRIAKSMVRKPHQPSGTLHQLKLMFACDRIPLSSNPTNVHTGETQAGSAPLLHKPAVITELQSLKKPVAQRSEGTNTAVATE